MKRSEFYTGRNSIAGDGNWYTAGLLKHGFKDWLKDHECIRVCDVGCGRGTFLASIATALQKMDIKCEAFGCDIVRHDNMAGGFKFSQQDFDGNRLEYNDNSFDLVTCNHVIEHIFQTEFLVSELARILKADGRCVLSTPNLSCLTNRVLILLGIQPLSVEVGTMSAEYGWPVFRRKLSTWTPAGHIRAFTARALRDMAVKYGFRCIGKWKQERKIHYRNIALILTKNSR